MPRAQSNPRRRSVSRGRQRCVPRLTGSPPAVDSARRDPRDSSSGASPLPPDRAAVGSDRWRLQQPPRLVDQPPGSPGQPPGNRRAARGSCRATAGSPRKPGSAAQPGPPAMAPREQRTREREIEADPSPSPRGGRQPVRADRQRQHHCPREQEHRGARQADTPIAARTRSSTGRASARARSRPAASSSSMWPGSAISAW
jgi:hypothetical protein